MKRRRSEPNPNPLFLKWLLEWKEEAAREKKESLKQCLMKAAKSLKECRETLYSGEDCGKLKYFGPKVCAMLQKRLDQHIEENGNLPGPFDDVAKTPRRAQNQRTPKTYVPKPGSGAHALLLTLYRQTPSGNKGFMTKAQLQAEAQPLCDTSLKKAQAGTFYTAWNSMTTLQKEGLVLTWSNPAKFRLTEAGKKLAEAIENANNQGNARNGNVITTRDNVATFDILSSEDEEEIYIRPKPHALSNFALDNFSNNVENIPSTSTNKSKPLSSFSHFDLDNFYDNIENIPSTSRKQSKPQSNSDFGLNNFYNNIENIPSTSTKQSERTSPEKDIFFFEPNTFDIILLVDSQETSGKAKQKDDPTYTELRSLNQQFEVRRLNVGDFMWIARCRTTKRELVLPHIVERKRIDDLEQSLKDSRYKEQKVRLKQSGIKNLIYLIESYAKNQHTTIDINTLFQLSVNTLIRDGFIVKYTDSHQDSMLYLSILTTNLRNIYKSKRLSSCDKKDLNSPNTSKNSESLMVFEKFDKDNAKTKPRKVKEMFLRQLIQIKGVSADKAVAIGEIFPTPKLLYTALVDSESRGENLLEPLQYGLAKRQIGPVISKTIYQLYTQRILT
ncbi:crossover junction endonuclease MUS81 [Leptopilina boulardi]|uniref:crossover junction endonuclease MUS81 n=1 Tax=Leptopilina boulardi TaxID=63433 RepID=UPI0021F585FE|nr:crossover junction endonuclease MUS81 [Leptopilina boulardi]